MGNRDEVGEMTKEMWDRLLMDFPYYPSPMIKVWSTPTRSSNFFYDEYYKGVWNEDKETKTDRSGE